MAHLAPENETKFDFQKYIKRSLENDFKVVVGISPIIWFIAVLFLLAYTHAVDFFNQVNLLYGTLTKFCTLENCPTMTAGPNSASCDNKHRSGRSRYWFLMFLHLQSL
ncbi:hypothetical protein V6Z11_D01G056200 [Gossypium hirsutum]|uniref:Uncharacterized protein n=1 Tax=Gossypium darwinii TaxID=34276 RepID=A0A5D2DM41_GOSDA|nr:hypothetical protein ES288_D01G060800v1 [Gossypium darwinii]